MDVALLLPSRSPRGLHPSRGGICHSGCLPFSPTDNFCKATRSPTPSPSFTQAYYVRRQREGKFVVLDCAWGAPDGSCRASVSAMTCISGHLEGRRSS